MVLVCDHCHYEFESALSVDQCPDCGKKDYIRPAAAEEAEAFYRRKLENVWDTAAG
ncbi:MAG: zinc ribbon-containing protein [Oscillospiraceae bacterium]|nr:zinc ribbon-containing protein [Oscillospiraceae bacterium]